jgi:hypothetical protein
MTTSGPPPTCAGQGVGDPALALLVGVGDRDAQLRPVAQQRLNLVAVAADDDHQIGDAGPGEAADREVDHRLVEQVEDVLVHDRRHRPQARAQPSRQHHSLHDSSSR